MSSLSIPTRFRWKDIGGITFIGDNSLEFLSGPRCFQLFHSVNSWFLLFIVLAPIYFFQNYEKTFWKPRRNSKIPSRPSDMVFLFINVYWFNIRFLWSAVAESTALQRQNAENLKQIFPEKEYRGLSPNFYIPVSVSELYIPTMGLPFLLEEICGPILGQYKSLTDTWMWKLGLRPRNFQEIIHTWNCRCSFIGFPQYRHLIR